MFASRSGRQKLFIVALAVCVLLLALILYFTVLKGSTQNTSLPFTPSSPTLDGQEEAKPGLPVRLKIPKIGVDAAVDRVGLTSQGDLDVPDGPDNTGWYESGPRPGETGSSVIDGHFGYRNNIPAVFDNLHKLVKGDVLYIEDEEGKTITFVVSGSRTYSPKDDATAVFRSSDGKAHLNLVTCQGDWNQNQRSYTARLVVFADKAGE